jgi:methyl-accepting chemotaxis protein
MALTLLAFAIPLAILIRSIAADRAIARANDDVRALSTLVALNPDPGSWRLNVEGMTVFLPGQRPIGSAERTPAVQLAQRDGSSVTVSHPDGTEIVVAVIFAGQGTPPSHTAVVRAFVPDSVLTKGVSKSWLILSGLGLLLLAVGILIANLLVGTVTKPISELARVSHRLAAGGLEARASPAGPPEVRELAFGLNHLAGRIRELIHQERESVADLSHRLRTPLTALRLELEGMGSSADPDGRLSQQVHALEGAVTSLIEDARTRGTTAHGSCDAAEVTRQRAEFWSVLAEDQGRPMRLDLACGPLMVGVAEPEREPAWMRYSATSSPTRRKAPASRFRYAANVAARC